jgi:hypothetical protein
MTIERCDQLGTPDHGVARDVTEPFSTLGDAARALGLTYVQLQRAVRRGLFPCYRPLGRRPLVRLSELRAVIETFREGGDR